MDINSTIALEAAHAYTDRKWFVVPIPKGEKAPNLNEWQNLRITKEELPKYFSNGSNIGLLLGETSGGLVDVDLDCRQALEMADVILPATTMIHGRTGSPNSHRWYVTMPSGAMAQFRDLDGSMMVELRSTGGQTVVPPSRHPSGETLAWVEAGHPATIPYDDLLGSVRRLAALCILSRHWPKRGSRNQAGLALAGFLLRSGMTTEQTESYVGLVAFAAGDEEAALRVGSVRATATKLASGRATTGATALGRLLGEKVVAKAREWLGFSEEAASSEWDVPIPLGEFRLPTFPTQALTGWMRDWVEAEAVATQTPVDLPAMLALAVCSASIAKTVVVRVTAAYSEPVNLWVVVVLPPGHRKSAVFSHATAPLEQHEATELELMAPQIAEAQSRFRVMTAELKRAENEAANGKPLRGRDAERMAWQLASFRIPAAPRLLVDECTPEKLATILSEQDGRIALMAPEGDVFDLMAGRYGGTANFGIYLRGHAGEDIRVDRVLRPTEHVKRATITMGLTVQPEVLRGLVTTPQFRGRGLLGRFLYALPNSPLGFRDVDPPQMPQEIADAYFRHVSSLLGTRSRSDDSGTITSHSLVLSPEARELHLEFASWLEPRLSETAELGSMADWAGKLSGAVLRIAGVLHMVSHVNESQPWTVPIASETLTNAVEIAKYLIEHAQAAFAEMGADGELSNARFLLAWFRRNESIEFTKRDLFTATKARFHRAANIEPALAILEEHGYVRKLPEEERRARGRRPSAVYEVNPMVHGEIAAHGSISAISAICAAEGEA